MKQLVMVFALAIVACKGGDKDAAGGKDMSPKCLHVGDGVKAMVIKSGGSGDAPDAAFGHVAKHCMADGWSDELIACVHDITDKASGDACMAKMTDDQRTKFNAEAAELTKPHSMNDVK